MTSALPLLYQAGYLTIKGYDFYSRNYTLDFPNAEVKVGFMDNFLSSMMGIYNANTQGFAGNFYASSPRFLTSTSAKRNLTTSPNTRPITRC